VSCCSTPANTHCICRYSCGRPPQQCDSAPAGTSFSWLGWRRRHTLTSLKPAHNTQIRPDNSDTAQPRCLRSSMPALTSTGQCCGWLPSSAGPRQIRKGKIGSASHSLPRRFRHPRLPVSPAGTALRHACLRMSMRHQACHSFGTLAMQQSKLRTSCTKTSTVQPPSWSLQHEGAAAW
jgi:hypothetical protein